MDFISQLVQFATSPLGLFVLVAGGLWVFTAKLQGSILPWLMLATFGFAASLAEFRNEFIQEAPNLVFPLEQLRQAGRPLTVGLLALLLALALRTPATWRKSHFPRPLVCLCLLQVVFLLKVLYGGDPLFGLISAVTYCSVVTVVVLGPSRWLQTDRDFAWGLGAIALVGAIFLGASLYQAQFDVYPITFVQNRFLGTTGNPQHAAVLLMLTLPAWYFLLMQPQPFWQRSIWGSAVVITLYALVQTGSRTGLLGAVVGLVIFFGQRLKVWQMVLVFMLVGAIAFGSAPGSTPTTAELPGLGGGILPERFVSTENTRAQVWQAQWNSFMRYPVLGAPLRGDRLGFGENSWLAAAASAGLVGLLPLTLFAYFCLEMMVKLYRIGDHPDYRLYCSAVTAGLSSLLIGSVSEAYLLGLISFPLLALGLYLVLGQYLLECWQRDRPWQTDTYDAILPLPQQPLR
jgi:O-antigen ligase